MMKRVGWRGESYRHYLAAKGIRTGTRVVNGKYFINKTLMGNPQVGSPGSDQRRAQEVAERYGLDPEALMSEVRLRREKYGKGRGDFEVDVVRLAKEMKLKELDRIEAMALSPSSTSEAIKEARRRMSLSDDEWREEEFRRQQKLNLAGIRDSGWSRMERQIMREAEERAEKNMLHGVETPEERVEGIGPYDPDYQKIRSGVMPNPMDKKKEMAKK